tara:strand:+ start:3514 stop:3654 length:141 start_codon:yes stop_codon:yes gene_type:complete
VLFLIQKIQSERHQVLSKKEYHNKGITSKLFIDIFVLILDNPTIHK